MVKNGFPLMFVNDRNLWPAHTTSYCCLNTRYIVISVNCTIKLSHDKKTHCSHIIPTKRETGTSDELRREQKENVAPECDNVVKT